MHILAISENMDRPESGCLIALANRGFQIHLIANPGLPYERQFQESGIRYYPVSVGKYIDNPLLLQIRTIIDDYSPQCLHCFTKRGLSNALLASWRYRLPIVAYRGTMGNISRLNPSSHLTYLHSRVSKIFCVSHAVRESLVGIVRDPNKLVTVYKGHDPGWYSDIPDFDFQSIGIPAGSRVISYLANMRPHKGADALVKAAAFLEDKPGVHFVFVGKVSDRRLKKLQKASPVANRIHFIGFRSDALSILKSSTCSVLMTTKREGFPKSIIESMSLGVPVVVSDVGGMPEIVRDGTDGFVVPKNDPPALASALSKLLDDRQLLQSCGSNCRDRIRNNFHINQTADQIAEIYQELAVGTGNYKAHQAVSER